MLVLLSGYDECLLVHDLIELIELMLYDDCARWNGLKDGRNVL